MGVDHVPELLESIDYFTGLSGVGRSSDAESMQQEAPSRDPDGALSSTNWRNALSCQSQNPAGCPDRNRRPCRPWSLTKTYPPWRLSARPRQQRVRKVEELGNGQGVLVVGEPIAQV